MMRRKAVKRSPRLIVLEGADGVGKSALAVTLARRLENLGEKTCVVSFPGREIGTLGAHIYEVHHEPKRFGIEKMTAASKQLLHVAAHIDMIEANLQPWLRDGKTVILDRFWWSTWVYGRIEGVSVNVLDTIINVEREMWGRTRPALTVLVRRREPLDRDVDLPAWNKIQSHYSELAMRVRTEAPVLFLDDSPSPEVACRSVLMALDERAAEVRGLSRQEILIDLATPEQATGAPVVLTHLSPIKATAAYDTYWRFAFKRQEIFFKRLEGRPAPWTDDPILQTFKFTNAYRASDRVSQFLIKDVIYGTQYPTNPEEVFFRTILFKLFNKIGTWELLERVIGPILYSEYSFDRYDDVLTQAMARGERIYSGAYIMPSGGRVLGSSIKHRNHLRLLERMMADDAPRKIQNAKTMHAAFDILLTYPMIGEFLAYQYIIDLNYSEMVCFSERDFVVPGPGALDGIRKCFTDLGGLNEPEVIRFIADQQDREFERLGLSFRSLCGRPLQLIDCQNLFCEVNKYSRVHHPDLAGISGRTRIKQRFSQNPSPISYWYPPKWGLNDRIIGALPNQILTKETL
jgi:thymidylate kinase